MGNGITFDTHKFVTGLVAKKMPKEQAEFLADTYSDLLVDRMATKRDLKELEERLESKIDLLEERMTRKMWQQNVATLVIYIAVMAGLLRLMGVA